MRDFFLYNTLGRSVDSFKPIEAGKVGFYGCGPTVYNYAHIGNLRTYIFEDLLVRALRRCDYAVTHVMNITDVGHLTGDDDSGEDKMVKSAEERGQGVLDIARFYTEAFFNDTGRLNIARPDIVCKATDHVGDMITLIGRIEAGGFTYFAGGNLYFDVSKFPRYGDLALLKLDDLKAGARIEVDANKRNPADFVLWFTRGKFEKQALVWDSPWGRGYPGWHIECSAMSMKYLGESIDIHAGGIDHVPIHHTNEIAQSEAATGKKWVNWWLHGEFLVLSRDGVKGKMSKSTGAFLTLQSLVDAGYHPLDYRFFCLGAHYRSQLQFSIEGLDSARSARVSLNDRVLALRQKAGALALPAVADLGPSAASRVGAFLDAVALDLALPRALAELWGLLRDPAIPPAEALAAAFDMDRILALGLADLEKPKEATIDPAFAARVDALIKERAVAKKERDFAKADAIRAEINLLGVALADSPSGSTWKLAPKDGTTASTP